MAIIISYPTSVSEIIIVLLKAPTKYREFCPTLFVKTTNFQLVFNFEQMCTVNTGDIGDISPDVMVYLTCAVTGLGGRGVIKAWTEVAARVRLNLHADVRSHLSGSSAIQPLAASEAS